MARQGSTPAPHWRRALRAALQRGATHPRATAAHCRPRSAAGQHPRPTLVRGATHCSAAREHSPARHGRRSRAAWRGGAAPPPHTGADRDALPCGAGPRTPAPQWRRPRHTAFRRGATHPRATVADRGPHVQAGQHPRPTLVQVQAPPCFPWHQPGPGLVHPAVPLLLSGRAAPVLS